MTVRTSSPQVIDVSVAVVVSERASPDFTAIFDTHFDYIWHTLRRLGVRSADLEDVTHEVFLAVHRHLSELDLDRPVRPWLFVFALRGASDYRHLARHRLDFTVDSDQMRDPGPLPDELAIARERLDRVAVALDSLDLDRRAIFVLHEIDGIPTPDAARILGIPMNTAYSRLRLAREDFASAVTRLDAQRRGAR